MDRHLNIPQNSKKNLYKGVGNRLLASWQQLQSNPDLAPHCFIGFDGFTDDIVEAVDQRLDRQTYRPIETIAALGERISLAAAQSCNIELVPIQQKVGGNAPILTCALLEGCHKITFAGAIGLPGAIEPLFHCMAERCAEAIALCPSGHSDAIEFIDGKIILGKHMPLLAFTLEHLLAQIPLEAFHSYFSRSKLIVNANWTMMPMMTDFWLYLKQLPAALPAPYFFVDLADPAKRSDDDLYIALEALRSLQERYKVIVGLNKAEAQRIAILMDAKADDSFAATARQLQRRCGVEIIIIHCATQAAAASAEECVESLTPYCPTPIITTGAGDNFNAGFCNALLYGLNLEECLISAVATGGYYVRNGKSPSMPALADFLQSWAECANLKS